MRILLKGHGVPSGKDATEVAYLHYIPSTSVRSILERARWDLGEVSSEGWPIPLIACPFFSVDILVVVGRDVAHEIMGRGGVGRVESWWEGGGMGR